MEKEYLNNIVLYLVVTNNLEGNVMANEQKGNERDFIDLLRQQTARLYGALEQSRSGEISPNEMLMHGFDAMEQVSRNLRSLKGEADANSERADDNIKMNYERSQSEESLEHALRIYGIKLAEPFIDQSQGFTMPFVERYVDCSGFGVGYDRWLEPRDFPEYVGRDGSNEMPLDVFLGIANDPNKYSEVISFQKSGDKPSNIEVFLKNGRITGIESDCSDESTKNWFEGFSKWVEGCNPKKSDDALMIKDVILNLVGYFVFPHGKDNYGASIDPR